MVGEKEKADRLVNVRTRDNKVHGMHALADVITQLAAEQSSRSLLPCFGADHSAVDAVASSAASDAPSHPGEGKQARLAA